MAVSKRRRAVTGGIEEASDRLVADFRRVVQDAEELLKATAGQSGEAIDAARTRAEDTLREARLKLGELEDDFFERTREAAKSADDLVHERPWQAVTLAAGIGFLLGLLTGRR